VNKYSAGKCEKASLVVPIFLSSTMISEETPLVSSPTKHEEVYKRFKPAKKQVIVALVSVTGLLARTSSSS